MQKKVNKLFPSFFFQVLIFLLFGFSALKKNYYFSATDSRPLTTPKTPVKSRLSRKKTKSKGSFFDESDEDDEDLFGGLSQKSTSLMSKFQEIMDEPPPPVVSILLLVFILTWLTLSFLSIINTIFFEACFCINMILCELLLDLPHAYF